jgi:DNA-binding MarR family transcriptional regulator
MDARHDIIEATLNQYQRLTQLMLLARAACTPLWNDIGITLPQLRVLGILLSRADGISGRELATLLGVGPSAVTPLIDRLVEHGYVRREEDRLDRRITRVLLTEAGLGLLQRMTAGRREQMADLLRHLDTEELATVDRALRILGQAVERSRADAGSQPVVAATT